MESEAALRALIDRIEKELHRDGPCVLSNADVRDVLTTLADLRARLAAVEGELRRVNTVCESAKLEHRKVSGMWMAERQRAIAAEQQRDTARALLAETLRPGAYGVGSTLAARIDAALSAPAHAPVPDCSVCGRHSRGAALCDACVTDLQQQRDTARAALAAIKRDPHGCPFCDSGVLRGPKPHDPACGFALLDAALSAPEGRCEGRYLVPHKRDEPFDVTYRCALPNGHDGPHGDGNAAQADPEGKA